MNKYTILFAIVTYVLVAWRIGWTGEYAGSTPTTVHRAADAADQKK